LAETWSNVRQGKCDTTVILLLMFTTNLYHSSATVALLEENVYYLTMYTVSQKTCDYVFYNNLNNKCPITIIFGIVSGKSTRHRKMVSFPTSPI